MNQTKSSRLSLPLVFTTALLGLTPLLRADSILNISQPSFDTGLPTFTGEYAWQSFTTPNQPTVLTTFAFSWNGSSDLSATAPVELLVGEGTGGTVKATVTGSYLYDDPILYPNDPYAGSYFFVANFGGVSLSPNQQYTVYFNNPTDGGLWLTGTDYSSYAGGDYSSTEYGYTPTWDATFFTPSPIGESVTVPEPSMFGLLGIGGLVLGGYAWRKKQRTA